MCDFYAGLRHGVRIFSRAPGCAAPAVMILATGIGASTVMCTLVQSVLLRELPFQNPERLGVPVMPNMVSLIANAPHPDEARRLIDYLLSPDVERQLAQSEAVQIPLHAGVPGPKNIPAIETFKPMTLDYVKGAARVEDVTSRLATILGL